MSSGGSQTELSRSQRPRLATVCGLLALVMLITFACLASYARSAHGLPGIYAAAIAVGICWIASTAALVVSGMFVGTPNAINGQLGSILLRTVLPLVSAIVLEKQVPFLAQAGLFGMMVPAYLVSLVAETLLSLWLAGPTRSVAKAL